jgi:3-phenylpropionate/trans-cinnamate dioxygenase ferredoxin subunit
LRAWECCFRYVRTGELHNWANFPPGIQLLNVLRSEKALKTYRAVVEGGEVVVEV